MSLYRLARRGAAALLLVAALLASAAAAGANTAPYDSAGTSVAERPSPANADANAQADRTTGRLSVDAAATGLPVSAGTSTTVVSADAVGWAEETLRVNTAGEYRVVVTVRNARGTSSVNGDGLALNRVTTQAHYDCEVNCGDPDIEYQLTYRDTTFGPTAGTRKLSPGTILVRRGQRGFIPVRVELRAQAFMYEGSGNASARASGTVADISLVPVTR